MIGSPVTLRRVSASSLTAGVEVDVELEALVLEVVVEGVEFALEVGGADDEVVLDVEPLDADDWVDDVDPPPELA